MAFFQEIALAHDKERRLGNDRFLLFEDPYEFLIIQEAAVARTRYRIANAQDHLEIDEAYAAMHPVSWGLFTNPQQVEVIEDMLCEFIGVTYDSGTLETSTARFEQRQKAIDFMEELRVARDLFEATRIHNFEAELLGGR